MVGNNLMNKCRLITEIDLFLLLFGCGRCDADNIGNRFKDVDPIILTPCFYDPITGSRMRTRSSKDAMSGRYAWVII